MKRKNSTPIITNYQAKQLLDLARLFYSDPTNVQKYEEWQRTRKRSPRVKATAKTEQP